MNKIYNNLIWIIMSITILLISLSGCAVIGGTSLKPAKATIGYTTAVYNDLISLPEPQEKIILAVYKFRDQTGQYKSGTPGTTFSTAVSQGATSMLIKALEDSKWFIPIEREGLPNLLNERKIIRSTRMQYQAENKEGEKISPLPPLLYAGLILEGGIISYETDIVTGGFGARYFGLGGSSQFRKDKVTVYLRAVSTQNGRILKSVSTTKTILSKQVDLGVYRFVRLQRVLEAETGLSTNEPPQMCVLEAIEKAVFDLIIEGIGENLWSLKNTEDFYSPLIQNYLIERDEKEKLLQFDEKGDLVGVEGADYLRIFGAKGLGFGFNVSAQRYAGDYPAELKPSYDFFIRYGITPSYSLMVNLGMGGLRNRDDFETDIFHSELRGLLTLFPEKKLTPYIFLGAGALNYRTDYWFREQDEEGEIILEEKRKCRGWEPTVNSGIGIEYFFSKNFSMHTTLNYQFTFSDMLDGDAIGGSDDHFWNLGLGFTLYPTR